MAPRKGRHPTQRFSSSHIKRMMQVDEDIGKVAQAVPAMIGRALELFSTMLVQKSGEITSQRGAKTLTQEHVITVIREDPRLDFLVHLVEGKGGGKFGCSKEMEVKKKDMDYINIGAVKSVEKVEKDKKSKSKTTTPTLLKQEVKSKTNPNKNLNSKFTATPYQLTLQVAPLQDQPASVPQAVTIVAQNIEVDEDYDC